MGLDHYLSPHTQVNSKWIKGLTVLTEAIKLLQEKIDGELFNFSLGDDGFWI